MKTAAKRPKNKYKTFPHKKPAILSEFVEREL